MVHRGLERRGKMQKTLERIGGAVEGAKRKFQCKLKEDPESDICVISKEKHVL